jgi:cell division protein FtsB
MTKYHIFYIIIILLLALYLVFGNKGLLQYKKLLDIQKKYELQTKKLEEKTKELEKEIKLIKRDREYLEVLIKKKLNLKKEKEDLYIIDNENTKRIGNK